MSIIPTPDVAHITRDPVLREHVYDPAEDTFLFLDALEKVGIDTAATSMEDLAKNVLFLPLQESEFLRNQDVSIVVEVGSGSGCIGVFFLQLLQHLQMPAKNVPFLVGVDINPMACNATVQTAKVAETQDHVDVLCSSLTSSLRSGIVDIILFNPPYVPTPSEEVCWSVGDISASWAGGEHGREVITAFVADLPRLLSKDGTAYLLIEKQNVEEDIFTYARERGLEAMTILKQKRRNETLSVLRLKRDSLTSVGPLSPIKKRHFLGSTESNGMPPTVLALPPASYINWKDLRIAGRAVRFLDTEPAFCRRPEQQQHGDTGLQAWDASALLANYLEKNCQTLKLKGSTVLELGAGLGLPALAAAALGAHSVYATDLPYCLPALKRNLDANKEVFPEAERIYVHPLDWKTPRKNPFLVEAFASIDYVLAADVIWLKTLVPAFFEALNAIAAAKESKQKNLASGPLKVVLSHVTRSTEVDALFFQFLEENRFVVVKTTSDQIIHSSGHIAAVPNHCIYTILRRPANGTPSV